VPTAACAVGGFVAAGTSYLAPGPSQVYVVRVAADGARLWERTYDVGPGGDDEAWAVVEARDGSGFIIAGGTRANPGNGVDVLLLKIKCNGSPVWAVTYHTPQDESAWGLVEARSGDAAQGTAPGDLLVAGRATKPAGDDDAFLMRSRPDGTLIWNRRYEFNNANEVFIGLTEARPAPGFAAGDVVAVGEMFLPPGQGYTVRVNGNTGKIGATPQGAAIYGGSATTELFWSVAELVTPPHTGHLVMAGIANSPATSADVYLVRTEPDPTVPLAQRLIGDSAAAPLGGEGAFDMREVRIPVPLSPAGGLALAGEVGSSAAVSDGDAFLLIADPGTLKPLPGTGRRYGDHAARRDAGFSIVPHSAGFLIAGVSHSNFESLAPPDPSDLYLVNTDGLGHTGCDLSWTPPSAHVALPVEKVSPVARPFLAQTARAVVATTHNTGYQPCP
jgi:hypothetical protein